MITHYIKQYHNYTNASRLSHPRKLVSKCLRAWQRRDDLYSLHLITMHSYKRVFSHLTIILSLGVSLFSLISLMGIFTKTAVATTSAQNSIIHYVTTNGNSNGSSWINATNLQGALTNASAGDEIWVAMGVYTPGVQRTDSFSLVPNVAIYGGFAATETNRTDRDWLANPTVLSGDIDNNDIVDSNGVVTTTDNIVGVNSYHVVLAEGKPNFPITENTVLDGFFITSGQATSLSVFNTDGGGLYCDGLGGECNPTLANLTFSGNSAHFGGAIYNNGDVYTSSPSLNNISFSGNSAMIGGAMVNYGNSSPSLIDVSFSKNIASSGGALANQGIGSPILTNVTFSENVASSSGGAMHNYESSPSLTNVSFYNNSATNDGGAVHDSGGNSIFTDVSFTNNSAGNTGGAILNAGNSSILTNVFFSNNTAMNGGAMSSIGGNGTSNPTLINVIFYNNSATSCGGAMYNYGEPGNSIPILTNVTFYNNSAVSFGGALCNVGLFGNSAPSLTNVILWGNVAPVGHEIWNYYANPIIMNSLVEEGFNGNGIVNSEGSSVIDNGRNIDADPLFLDILNGDLRLQDNSPAIDSGNSGSCPEADILGVTRPQGGDCDMGAYEFIDLVYLYLPNILANE